jgi:hypothetical protein
MRITLLTCLPLLLSAPLCAEQWLIDSESDCKVWSPDPIAATETISYTVKCVHGEAQGEGTLTVYENGKKSRYYQGEFVNGKWQHEKGTLTNYEDGVQITSVHDKSGIKDSPNEI